MPDTRIYTDTVPDDGSTPVMALRRLAQNLEAHMLAHRMEATSVSHAHSVVGTDRYVTCMAVLTPRA